MTFRAMTIGPKRYLLQRVSVTGSVTELGEFPDLKSLAAEAVEYGMPEDARIRVLQPHTGFDEWERLLEGEALSMTTRELSMRALFAFKEACDGATTTLICRQFESQRDFDVCNEVMGKQQKALAWLNLMTLRILAQKGRQDAEKGDSE